MSGLTSRSAGVGGGGKRGGFAGGEDGGGVAGGGAGGAGGDAGGGIGGKSIVEMSTLTSIPRVVEIMPSTESAVRLLLSAAASVGPPDSLTCSM